MNHKLLKEQTLPKRLFLYRDDRTAFHRFLSELPTELQYKVLTKLSELKYTHRESLHKPYFKSFSNKRYKGYIELRIRSKVLIRIIFIPQGNDYILLNFFVKTCPRDTEVALERAERVKKRLNEKPRNLIELVPSDVYYQLNSETFV